MSEMYQTTAPQGGDDVKDLLGKLLLLLGGSSGSIGTELATANNQATQITAEQAIQAAVKPAANLTTSQVTSTGTAATIAIARPTRKSVLFVNNDAANSVWVGPATVTTGNGVQIKPGQGYSFTFVGLLQVIDNGSHASVSVADEYQ